MTGCLACDLTTGRRPLPGGLIAQTSHWRVEHCIGPLGVGTLIVRPKRHVVRVAQLSGDEAHELGPLLQRTAAVVERLTGAQNVYVCLWSHGPVHVHFVVQPVLGDRDPHGPALQAAMFEAGEPPPPDEVAAFAARARSAFAGD